MTRHHRVGLGFLLALGMEGLMLGPGYQVYSGDGRTQLEPCGQPGWHTLGSSQASPGPCSCHSRPIILVLWLTEGGHWSGSLGLFCLALAIELPGKPSSLVLKFPRVALRTQLTYTLRTWFFGVTTIYFENIRKEAELGIKDQKAVPQDSVQVSSQQKSEADSYSLSPLEVANLTYLL